ncbi:DUF1730 domain-containing protein, partial [Myxococcota bacterium]|nr:DUF1730 domain-containing protein [Myxococcota bacterium]
MESTLGKLTKAMARHGVVAWGIAPPGPHEVPEAVSLWFSGAMQGKMDYLQQHLSLKVSAGNVLEGARAVISAALPYGLAGAVDGVPWPVAGYAWGVDYHLRVQETLTAVARECLPQGSFRVVVDSAPIPERYVAVLAGVGFVGKSG